MQANKTGKMEATCHCGTVRFRVKLTDGFNTARRCTCSYCRMRGAVAVSADIGGITFNSARQRFHIAVSTCRRRGDEIACLFFPVDGEAIATNERGLAVFDLIRHKRHGGDAVLIAFDLIEFDGEDLRRTPIEQRKRKTGETSARASPGIVLNEVFEGDGDILFEHACKLGCEGIVFRRPATTRPATLRSGLF